MNRFLILFSFLLIQNTFAQQAEIFKLKKFETAVLSDSLEENSGLTFFNGKLYTINDGGNSSEIFQIDSRTGTIKKTLITNLKNIDWEAVASDSAHLYIGEFGNNAGTRRDLKIYKIEMDSLLNEKSHALELPFYYPEQTDFTPRSINNDFDAEAMIYLNGKIHLFTKEWVSKATTHYLIDPNESARQPALKLESSYTGFVVTDAEYFQGDLYLIGYTKKTEVYLSVFKETAPGIFFNEKPRKLFLGSSLSLGQIEGIAVDAQGVYISGEKFRTPLGTARQRLYFVPHDSLRLK